MPLGSPLPPPLPPPPRLWPRPRCLPRTIMPSTAAGRGHWAAAAGARAVKHEPQHNKFTVRAPCRDAARKVPSAGRLPPSWAWPGPAAGAERAGQGSWELSFLPFFEIKILSSGRSAGSGSGGLCCQPQRYRPPWVRLRTWASGAVTAPGGTSPRRLPGLALWNAQPPQAHLLPRALWKLRRRRLQGRGCGRAVAATPSQSRVGACTDCAQRSPRSRSRPPRPGARGSSAALPAWQLTARGPEPRRHALPDRAPGGPLLAVGANPSPVPPRLGPAAAEISRGPEPRASDAAARLYPAEEPTQKVPLAPWPPAGAPAPAISVNHQLPSERGETERKGGDRKARGKHPLPLRARLNLGARPWVPARRGRRRLPLCPAAPRPRLTAAAPRRNLPGAYRNLLCGVTAFRLNPASSSRLSSRPLRRSRMLARCAAPPPGSWVAAGDAAAQHSAADLGLVVPSRPWVLAERPGSRRVGEGPPDQGLCAHPGEIGAQPPVGLTHPHR
ncbi:transcription initiation factor TFIID subunit 4-like [Sciurus carolinensis]|uniref:transcription initiation factor TFIID subunit 4-like n=1 Tax=Sciurus carolinensis TaxID=30640 RepID=UPI001FB48583|nr:transcription initiation factor TFIID subunit 4-like [Sciurus carolinensis]